MPESDGTSQLVAALAKARGEFEDLRKSKTANVKTEKGAYSYGYATLADVLAVVVPGLSKNGLAVVQLLDPGEERTMLITQLLHTSGEILTSRLPIPTATASWQAWGSALTYARRYSLMALLGLAADEDDDDGAAGDRHTPKPDPRRQARPAREPEPQPEPEREPGDDREQQVPECPRCSNVGIPSKYPRPGEEHFCGKCKKAY